ncbi:MAG TPA: HAD-IB family phosphatase [Pseudomonadota bacterium]|nr:HAD-IB family phosphatase [Xanthomonadales bacterium]HQW82621.1 HAD-IB family phosphatase [Pseudomonadota bacterium]
MNAPGRGHILALFDFDGTITTREMLPDFVHYAVPKWRLRLGKLILMPMVIGYRLGWVSGTAIRAAIARAGFRGMTVTDYEAKAKAFARDVLPGVLRPEMMTRIAAHRASGDTVVVVSGAYDVYLKHWCAEHGLDLIASTLEVRDGRLTGRYAGAQNVLAEKARHVRERFNFSAYAEIHAHGDTPEDQHLLALATRKFYRGVEVA